MVFQKIIRVRKIDFALKGQPGRNPLVKTALADFATVTGNLYAAYDSKLAAFLDELEKTGLINHIVEAALFNQCGNGSSTAFDHLHQRFFDASEGDSEALYNSMVTAFKVSLTELCKDKVLLEFIRLTKDDICVRLDRVEGTLLQQSTGGKRRSFDEIKPTLVKIARGLQSAYRNVRVETTKGSRKVEISRIYIPPKLRYRETRKNTDRVTAALQGTERSNPPSIIRSASDRMLTFHDNRSVDRFSYAELKQRFSRVVVLGDPGGGKSTLCQNLCYDLAKQANLALQAGTGRDTAAQTQKLPFRIVLRLFERARALVPQLTILDYLCADLANHVTTDPTDIRQSVLYSIETGRAVLAFDGLDEILATAQRREYVDLVSAFAEQFPLCPVLVTSRLVGYDNAPLGDDFEEILLEKFDDDEVTLYVKKFMMVVGGRKENEAVPIAQAFFSQTTSNAADLRRNPLMLGLMAWLFEMRRDVPSNRPEIYQECAILMFERWDPDRDIRADVPPDFDRLQLFSELASKIFGTDASAGVSRSWLEWNAKLFLDRVYENKSVATENAKRLARFITGRAWVMSEIGEGTFAFTHQTFLEYFFARHLDANTDSVSEVIEIIKPKVAKREWDVVSQLSLQIKTYRNLRRIDTALIHLVDLITTSGDASEMASYASFSARALEYLSGSEANVRRVVEEIFTLALKAAVAGDYQAFADVEQCERCAFERREFVQNVITGLLVTALKSEDLLVARQAATLLSGYTGRGSASRRYRGRSQQVPHLSEAIGTTVRANVRNHFLERVERDEFYAKHAWEWYGRISEALVRRYGLDVYNGSDVAPFFDDGLISIAVSAASSSNDDSGKSEAVFALKALGQGGLALWPLTRPSEIWSSHVHVPFSWWTSVAKSLEGQPAAIAGLIFVMMYYYGLEVKRGRFRSDNTRMYVPPPAVGTGRKIAETLPDGKIKARLLQVLQARSVFRLTEEESLMLSS